MAPAFWRSLPPLTTALYSPLNGSLEGVRPMTNDEFWAIVERAWNSVPGNERIRPLLQATDGATRAKAASWANAKLGDMLVALSDELKAFAEPKRDRIAAYDKTLRRLVARLDRPALRRHLRCPETFLSACAFVVACGQSYYAFIARYPAKCPDCRFFAGESMLNAARKVEIELYGQDPEEMDEEEREEDLERQC